MCQRHLIGLASAVLVAGWMIGAGAAEESPANTREGSTVSFEAAGGITVYGDLYRPHDKTAPLLLLFHQAGSEARGEYGLLIPRLVERGFNVLAIDQRAGGSHFGHDNRTMTDVDRKFGYCDAYPDLEAAVAYAVANGYGGKRIAWGSSYSAALIFKLAVEHAEEVDAVLAFSPATGEPMDGCRGEPYARQLRVPALALRPASEMTRDSSQQQFAEFESLGIQTHVADPGVHGSSMLNPARVEGDVEKTWQRVLKFLDEVAPR